MNRVTHSASFLFAVGASLLAGCLNDDDPELAIDETSQAATISTVRVTLDPNLRPAQATLAGRPLAQLADAEGRRTDFITNEVIVRPRDPAELAAFLARTGGVVVKSDAVPTPPAGMRTPRRPTAAEQVAKRFVVRLTPPAGSVATLGSNLQALGFGGVVLISAQPGLDLLALVSREQRAGLAIRPNFVARPTDMVHDSFESGAVDPSNAFSWGGFQARPALDGANTSRAWQLIAAFGPPIQKRAIAIIDGGFWLSSDGTPKIMAEEAGTDLPAKPVQWDFVDGDQFADGTNPSSCTGGTPCPWHGNRSASVSTAIMGNMNNAVGSGALVAEPWLFKSDLSDGATMAALATARAWGADVVSMSFGGECGGACQWWRGDEYFDAFADASAAGLVLVSTAGNSPHDVTAVSYMPCTIPDVICVGAASDNPAHPKLDYSGHGARVDIFAPTNFLAMDDESHPEEGLPRAGGTSASAPFVAGVIAMLRHVDPSLSPAQVRALLQTTAHTNSTDPLVPHYIDAYAAVRDAMGYQLANDALEVFEGVGGVPLPEGTFSTERVIHDAFDNDLYTLDMKSWAHVNLDIRHMRELGAITVALEPLDGQAAPETVTYKSLPAYLDLDTRTNNNTLARFTYCAPGKYRVRIRSTHEQPYAVRIASFESAKFDPDAYENNNSSGVAKSVSKTSDVVTNHTWADVDYYKFTNLPLSFPWMPSLPWSTVKRVTMAFQHGPATVQVTLDPAFGSYQMTYGPAKDFDFTLPHEGIYEVKVTPTTAGRYTFTQGDESALRFDPTLPELGAWVIDMEGPVTRYLPRAGELVVMGGLGGKRELSVAGDGLRFELLDINGRVLAEGRPQLDARGQLLGYTLPLHLLEGSAIGLLQVSRTDEVVGLTSYTMSAR
jgi:hypothetical protein